jgi:hypothetical protein
MLQISTLNPLESVKQQLFPLHPLIKRAPTHYRSCHVFVEKEKSRVLDPWYRPPYTTCSLDSWVWKRKMSPPVTIWTDSHHSEHNSDGWVGGALNPVPCPPPFTVHPNHPTPSQYTPSWYNNSSLADLLDAHFLLLTISLVPLRNVPEWNAIWIFRPRNFVMKRPWDKTVLGTNQSLSLDKKSSLR